MISTVAIDVLVVGNLSLDEIRADLASPSIPSYIPLP
jgi:hypothetical protein